MNKKEPLLFTISKKMSQRSGSSEKQGAKGIQEAKSVREDVDDLLTEQNQKRFLKQAQQRGLGLEQWLDLLNVAMGFFHLSGHVNQLNKKDERRMRNWIKDVFQFNGAQKIKVKGGDSLDLSTRPLIRTIPKGLDVRTLFLSKKISKKAKKEIQELRQRGDIRCTIIYL